MAYIALYREWRPKTFSDLVGQQHVSQTLKNALAMGRVSHAYLFCGPRGTGKTSTAKVLAKALNCQQGPTSEPCNQCFNCQNINLGSSMDVLEIDAASNRGIDEIRDLREKVKLAATEGKYKVYIIDEVHMLTTEAFNALLKTLEEPPDHVIFILATTEPHKIPATILSRCQRFDFRRIGFGDMLERLKYIAEKEGLEVTSQALDLIVKGSEGGMRDALSMMDQCISYSGKEINENDVMAVMGTMGVESLNTIAQAISEKDLLPGIQVINEVFTQGKEIRQFIKDLVEFFRQILLVKVCQGSREIVQVPESTLALLNQLSLKFSRGKLIQIINSFTEAEREMKWTTQPRLLLELALIKSLQDEYNDSVDSLIERIAQLEEKLADTAPSLAQTPPKELPKTKPVALENFFQSVEPSQAVEPPKLEVQQVDPIDLVDLKKRWRDFLEFFKASKKVSLYAIMIEGEPLEANGNSLTIAFKYPFHKERVEAPENRRTVEEILKKFFGRGIKVNPIIRQETEKVEKEPTNRQEDPLIKEAIHLFGGEVIEIND